MLICWDAPAPNKASTLAQKVDVLDMLLGLEFMRKWKILEDSICAVYKQAFYMGEKMNFLLPSAVKYYVSFLISEAFMWM